MSRPKSERVVIAVALTTLCAAAVLAAYLGTWTDEEYTLGTTAHGPLYALGRALTYELQAPLYFVLESIWREANLSLWWARLPSLLCTFALFFVFRRIGRRVDATSDPVWFATLATLNPFVVFAAFEIRLYAFALLLAGAMWLLFDAGFISERNGRAAIGFIVVAIAAIYTQYFLGFALAGFGAALVVRRDRSALQRFALACIPIAIAAAPLAVWAHQQIGGYDTEGPDVSFLLRHSALHPWMDFIFPYERDWDIVSWPRRTYDALVVLAALTMLAARPRLSAAAWGWVVSAIVVEGAYVALLVVLHVEIDDRHYVGLYVPLAVAVYAVTRTVVASGRARYNRVFILTAVLTAAVLVTRYRHAAQPGDWARVGAYLASAARPGDAIVAYAADVVPALRRTYHGDVPIVPFPETPSPDAYAVDVLVVHSVAQAERALAPLRGYRHVWFVDSVRCRSDEQSYGCINVMPAIRAAFAIRGERDFYGTKVLELTASGR